MTTATVKSYATSVNEAAMYFNKAVQAARQNGVDVAWYKGTEDGVLKDHILRNDTLVLRINSMTITEDLTYA